MEFYLRLLFFCGMRWEWRRSRCGTERIEVKQWSVSGTMDIATRTKVRGPPIL